MTVVRCIAEERRAIDPRRSILQYDTPLKRRQGVGAEASGNEDVINAADTVAGMRQAESEVPVVGEEKEPPRVVVEPAPRMEGHAALGDQVAHPPPAAGGLS